MTESTEKSTEKPSKPKDLVQEVVLHAVTKEGYSIGFTLRDYDTNPLVMRLRKLLDWLPGEGCTPPVMPALPEPVVVNVATGPAPKDEEGGGGGGEPEEQECEHHHLPMSKHEKDGQTWWSHKLPNGKYCKGKAPYGK
jgi:hypothetical protein